MKIPLANILSSKEQIIELIRASGFSENIKIYVPEFVSNAIEIANNSLDYELTILVKVLPEKTISYKNLTLLQSKLIELLNCQVTVTNKDSISKLYQYEYDRRNKSFSDPDLSELFDKKSFEEIFFKSIDQENSYLQPILVKQANEFLKKIIKTHYFFKQIILLTL